MHIYRLKQQIITSVFLVKSLLILGFVLCVSCSNDESKGIIEQQAVSFTSSNILVTPDASRGIKNWNNNSKIGVSMFNAGKLTVYNMSYNIPYLVNSEGVLHPLNQSIYYPLSNILVDFIAYYPYQNALQNNIYKVDVSDQTQNIDLLYSNNANNKSKSTEPIQMLFAHKLSKITIYVEAGLNISVSDLENLTTSIKQVPITANFDLKENQLSDMDSLGNIPLQRVSDRIFTGILIPYDVCPGAKVKFEILEKGSFEWDVSAISFKRGNHYRYTVVINKDNIEVSLSNITIWKGIDDIPETGEVKPI